MVSVRSLEAASSQDRLIFLVYMRSVKLSEGVMLMTSKSVKLACTGMVCCSPLRQSSMRLEWSSWSSFVVMLLLI